MTVSHSGGKDSEAMMSELIQHIHPSRAACSSSMQDAANHNLTPKTSVMFHAIGILIVLATLGVLYVALTT